MSLQFAVFNKCRACLSPETIVEFVHLSGSIAERFKAVIGIELPIGSDEGDSMICPDCFSELERLHNFKVVALQAEHFFKLKRMLAPVLKRCNEESKRAAAAEAMSTESIVIVVEPSDDDSSVIFDVDPASSECDFSSERFQGEARVRRPKMVRHLGEKKFFCSKCGYGFKTDGELQKHLSATKIYKCAICDGRFSCKLLLDRHRIESHESVLKCDKCSYQTKKAKLFMKHKGIHDKTFSCETCQKNFSTKEYFKLHQMHHKHGIYATAPEVTFTCSKCGKSFLSVHYLKRHQRMIHDENVVECKVCDKIFKNRNVLNRHSQTHEKVACSICNKMISKNSLSRHVRSHCNRFKCDLCSYYTKAKENLKKHIERMHLLKNLANDSKCREDFSDFEMLENQRSSPALTQKKLQCGQCKKAFGTRMMLKQHKRRVHPEKLFACEDCEKAFKTKHHLKQHKSGVHAKSSVQ